MKVCCELGKYWELMTPLERLGCNHDHCKGTVELEDYLLETCGTFDTRDCISYEDMRHLFKVKEKKDETTGD